MNEYYSIVISAYVLNYISLDEAVDLLSEYLELEVMKELELNYV
jgi:hypothetical protein